jgi:tetratricopeptide (TPR) repeat protein
LPQGDLSRAELQPDLAEALMVLGSFQAAREVAESARACAAQLSSPRIEAAAVLAEMQIGLYSGGDSQEILQKVQRLIPVLEGLGAYNELASAWRLAVVVHGIGGQFRLSSEAAERAIAHARKASNDRLVAKIGGSLSLNALLGPTPVREAIRQCEQLIAAGLTDRQVEAMVMLRLAQLKAMNDELGAARSLCRNARNLLRDLGEGVNAASAGIDVALVELLGGDLAFAEREVRVDIEFLSNAGETYYLSTMAALLSRLIRDQGRDDEALIWSKTAEQASAPDDVDSQALWRSVRAPIVARAGNLKLAEELARSACQIVKETEAPLLQADALTELAAVMRVAQRHGEAQQAAEAALTLYRTKGDVVSANRATAWLNTLQSP